MGQNRERKEGGGCRRHTKRDGLDDEAHRELLPAELLEPILSLMQRGLGRQAILHVGLVRVFLILLIVLGRGDAIVTGVVASRDMRVAEEMFLCGRHAGGWLSERCQSQAV